ncbi:aminotransferase class V-fold PLP-dependent enzyme [Microbacterium fluvii]|uniref:Aminotransferase class V-fold PLP-dependent enzyme n=1 Tax=Microbacterium fluvii TaxID=415215 RepID=A0ABW2HBI8_9MICO|nr:aminotransferase class V-fold PLP-dependent enzyme [Microbacterium fluvii]MCU4672326.1 aminotransferase class V-fold PLP-dependent enzyme [Microbacterium fluvii]
MSTIESYLASFDGEPGYLDWAAFGPLSPSVRAEVRADADLLGTGRRSSIDLVGENPGHAAALVAEMLDVPVDQVVLQPSTTDGLMQALFGLSGAVLVSDAEFPSLRVAAARAAQARPDLQVVRFEPDDAVVSPEAVREALTDDVTAVAVSLVDFRTGYRADLAGLREVIGDRLLIVDAVQGFGVVDADYAAADVVCAHGYKWLRAGRGTGFAWFGDRALERLTPVFSGLTGLGEADQPGELPPAARAARGFSVSRPDPLAAARLTTALRDVRDAGLDAIEAALRQRVDEVIAIADSHRIAVVTPRDPVRRAGIVALAPEPADAGPIAAALANHGLVFTAREGVLRIAPHAGTDEATMRMLVDALATAASGRAW